ncbi:MAG: DUF2723 domain-containing protein [Pelolinea sp.]|nr:DUF2723 domain-containing protein [Pelolinea sp.]
MLKNIILPTALVVILGLVYGMTFAPGLSWANGGADGGDLITAAAINGVPHPTGYPLYMLLAKLFQYFPIGNLAFRTNLLSACSTCLTAIMIYITVNRLLSDQKYSKIASSVAALAFGLSPLVWSQAVISEVYGLQSLLTILILYQTLFMGKKPFENLMRGIIFGLALGNQITTVFLLPFLLIENTRVKVFPNSKLLLRLIGLLVGSSIYLILPLRAMNNPAINWNNPVTINSLFQLISGQIYQSYFSTSYIIDRVRGWAGLLIEQFSIPGVFVGIFAIFVDQSNKKNLLLILWIFISYGAFALVYGSHDSYVYLIQTIIAFSLWIGLGFHKLLIFIANRWRYSGIILFPVIIVLFALHITFVIPKVDASSDNRATEFGKYILEISPANAMIFTEDDKSTFALWYFHFAEDQRPDIKVISEGLLEYDWYRQSLRTTYPNLIVPESADLSPYDLIVNNSRYPYCLVRDSDPLNIECFQY